MIVRDPARLPVATRERVEVVQGSHDDPAVVNQAFKGADSVFWLVPPNPRTDSVHAAYVDFTRPACAAMQSQGVQRVVGVSALGRGTALAGNAGLVTASLAMAFCFVALGLGATSAWAQSPAEAWPAQTVKIIVLFAAGGTTDVRARVLTERLSVALKPAARILFATCCALNLGVEPVGVNSDNTKGGEKMQLRGKSVSHGAGYKAAHGSTSTPSRV